jgi:hypothetical protein
LAGAYQVAGEKKLAKVNYKKAIELDPSNVHAKTMLAQVGPGTTYVLGRLLGGILMVLLLYFIANGRGRDILNSCPEVRNDKHQLRHD